MVREWEIANLEDGPMGRVVRGVTAAFGGHWMSVHKLKPSVGVMVLTHPIIRSTARSSSSPTTTSLPNRIIVSTSISLPVRLFCLTPSIAILPIEPVVFKPSRDIPPGPSCTAIGSSVLLFPWPGVNLFVRASIRSPSVGLEAPVEAYVSLSDGRLEGGISVVGEKVAQAMKFARLPRLRFFTCIPSCLFGLGGRDGPASASSLPMSSKGGK